MEAKYLGTYYTSVPAATLLLKLALDIERWPTVDWSDAAKLRNFRIGDLACGTGTLLMAASQALTDNFIKFQLKPMPRISFEHKRQDCIQNFFAMTWRHLPPPSTIQLNPGGLTGTRYGVLIRYHDCPN